MKRNNEKERWNSTNSMKKFDLFESGILRILRILFSKLGNLRYFIVIRVLNKENHCNI